MQIRNAQNQDLTRINNLLSQVLEIHAKIRPDLFISGTRKYTSEQLLTIINNQNTPIFVAEENNQVLGYCFCKIIEYQDSNNFQKIKTLYIDDLCVDEKIRKNHIGQTLYEYVVSYAKKIGCYNITLNVWDGNDSAKGFYQKMGFHPQKTTMEKIL